MLKLQAILGSSLVLLVAACGPGPQSKTEKEAAPAPVSAAPAAPEYDSAGVIASVEGLVLTIDHEGASGAALAAGRHPFRAYADVLAEAPLEPGARVAFKFRRENEELVLTDLRAR